jgi:hypothetical protein
VQTAIDIVNSLLEDIDADLPSHKSEVRILPTSDPRRFDVTLLTGFDPVYIGTLGYQGSVWKPVEVMPGVGRELRAKLHFVGPDKEAVAMTMVQTLKPIWKRLVTGHLMNQMESYDEIDPKQFASKISVEADIKRVVEQNYPNVEVLGVQYKHDFHPRYTAQIKSRDPAKPLWHSPIYSMIQDLEPRIASEYGWALRPYMNQQRFPEFQRTGKPVGIKPIGICYDNAGTPGVFNLYFDFNILRPDAEGGGHSEQADWGTPYGSPGEQQESNETEEFDPKAFVTNKRVVVNVRGLRDLQRFPDDQVFMCNDPMLMRSHGFTKPFPVEHVYWQGNGLVSVEFWRRDNYGVENIKSIDLARVNTLTPVLEHCSADEIAKEADKAEKPASPEQAEAGNYKKGHVCVQGLEIAIENAEGSTRSGTGKDGKTWKVTMPAHYGYLKGTQGKDKDHLDVYIGPKPDGMMVFVVNQQKEDTKGFDEHKIMLGFATKDEAIETYDRAFSGSLGPKLRQSVVSTTVDGLKAWIANGNTKKPFEGIVESLLENEDENGFEALKRLAMRAGQGAVPGTEYHIGFAISTSNQHDIEARANDDAIEVDWDAVNNAIPIIERNAMKALEEQGIRCRSEGHNGTDELVGSAWVQAGTGAIPIIMEFIDRDEPFSTTSGNIEHIQQGLSLNLYKGVPESIATLIDVSISFFDLDAVQNSDPLAESDDTKALAMRTPMRDPQVWGELKVGDVLFVPETGSYERIDALKNGYGSSYQGPDGRMVYDSGPAQFRLFSQFGPAYAYGHYVQHLSSHPKAGLLGAQLVELPDTSDEALWKLVDEEMHRNGTSPEELEQSRAQHREWLARPEQVAGRDARRRMDQMMGRVPEPPVEESEEIDAKSFVNAHPEVAAQWPPNAVKDSITRAATCMKLWFRQDYRHYLSDKEFLGDLGDAVSDCACVEFDSIPMESFHTMSNLADTYLQEFFAGKRLADYQKAHMKVWREIAAGLVARLLPHMPPPPLS